MVNIIDHPGHPALGNIYFLRKKKSSLWRHGWSIGNWRRKWRPNLWQIATKRSIISQCISCNVQVYHQLLYQMYSCIIMCWIYFPLHEIFSVLSLLDGGVLHCFALSSTLLAVKSWANLRGATTYKKENIPKKQVTHIYLSRDCTFNHDMTIVLFSNYYHTSQLLLLLKTCPYHFVWKIRKHSYYFVCCFHCKGKGGWLAFGNSDSQFHAFPVIKSVVSYFQHAQITVSLCSMSSCNSEF